MKNALYLLATAAMRAAVIIAAIVPQQTSHVNSRYRPIFHLAPEFGWMNDPNGFSYYNGEYHLFYQYNPYSSKEAGIAHWGHAKSPDLFRWKNLPIALSPEEPYDKDGVFSGSAIVENSTLYLLYTGNINYQNQTPDHEQSQHLAFSTDGINFEKYKNNPVILGADKQPNFRDPKVWKHQDTYYMVLGNEDGGLGRALLYSSKNMVNWTEEAVLAESDGSLGYMWECPDFFELEGKYVLLWSPQGIEPQGDNYRNLYQTGYMIGNFDYETFKFTPGKFREFDHGHDLYASQTIETGDDRRVMIAWMDMWEQVYPERDDGWTGMMTTPRELKLGQVGNETVILQWPVREFNTVRSSVLFSDSAQPGHNVTLDQGAAEVLLSAPSEATSGKLGLEIEWGGNISLAMWYESGNVTLRRGPGEDDVRRTAWKPSSGDGSLTWRILLDKSSVELFCGQGEVAFTSRFFPSAPVSLRVMQDSAALDLYVVSLKRTVSV